MSYNISKVLNLNLDSLNTDNDFKSLRTYLDSLSSVDILSEQLKILLTLSELEKSHHYNQSSNSFLDTVSYPCINYDFTLPTAEELLKLNAFYRDDYSKVINENIDTELSVKCNEDELYGDLSDETRIMLTNFDHTILEHVKAKQNSSNLKIGMRRKKRNVQDGSHSINTSTFNPDIGSNETKAIQLNKNGNPIIRRRKRMRFVEGNDNTVKSNADTYSSMLETDTHLHSDKIWPDAIAVHAADSLYTLASTWMGSNSDFSYLQNITTENQHVRVNVQSEEILCDFILELQKQCNLQIFVIDRKLQELKLLKEDTIGRSSDILETNEEIKTDALSLSLSKCSERGKLFYTGVVNGLGINIGRGAAAVCGDVFNIHKEYIEGFEAAWQHARKDSIDRSRKRWDSMHNLYHNTHEKKIGIDDLPYAMDRIPNPFNVFGGDARKWDWLTSSTGAVKRLQRFSKATAIGANFSFPSFQDTAADNLISKAQVESKHFSEDSILHPFIHSKSLYYNKVSMKECVHKHHLQYFLPNLLNLRIDLEESQKSKFDLKNELKSNVLSQEQLWAYYLYASTNKSNSSISNIDFSLLSKSSLVIKYEDEWSIKTLNYCVDQAVQLLSLPICSSINVIDKCDPTTTHEHMSLHRAVHISSILSRFLGREAFNHSLEANIDSSLELEVAQEINISNITNKSTRRKSGISQCNSAIWGPVLVVVQLTDISSWEDALTIMCSSRDLQFLPYYGSSSDRLTLRSYIKPNLSSTGTGLYTERSHAHVILMSYETLLQDLHHFTDILWCFSVFDEPWGMISNNNLVYPWKQLSSLLQARQKIFSSHCIARMQTMDNNVSHETDSEIFAAPGIVESINALCPYLLGISCLSNKIPTPSKMISQKTGFAVLPNSVAMLSYDSKKKILDLSEISLQYLSRLLASLTVVYDAEIVKVFKALNKLEDSSTVLFGLFDELMGLLPYFEWFGLQLTLESNSITSDFSNIHNTYTLNTCQTSSSSTFLKFLTNLQCMLDANLRFQLKHHTVTYTSEYKDVQLEKELEQLNLYAVGMIGSSVQRFKQVSLGDMSTNNPDQSKHLNKGYGRGRFKSKVGTESGESNNKRSYMWRGRGGGRGRGKGILKSSLKEEASSLYKNDENVIDGNYVNEIVDSANTYMENNQEDDNENDDDDDDDDDKYDNDNKEYDADNNDDGENGDEDNNDEDEDPNEIEDEEEEVAVEQSDNVYHKTNDVGKNYTEENINNNNDLSVINESNEGFNDRAEINQYTHESKEYEESKLVELKPFSSDNMEENPVKSNTEVSTKDSIPSIATRLSLEQMRAKYPAVKRDVKPYLIQGGIFHSTIWYTTIPISTRLKFLGVYNNETDAEKAFSIAYDQNELYLESCHNPKLPHLFKSRNNASVRITDGSFVSSDYYKELKNENIIDEIAFMSSVQSRLGYSWKDWYLTTCHQPPCFAKICSSDGSCIDITNLHCYLGKSRNQNLTNLMLKLGDCHNGSISGLNFKYDRESSTSEVIPHIHLEFDSSIACKHACLKFNKTCKLFEIQAISMAGIYINGLKVLPEHGTQTLRNHSVLQIGSRIMYFILPNLNDKVSFKLPIEQSCALIQTLLEYAKLRIYSDGSDEVLSIKKEDTIENNLTKNIETSNIISDPLEFSDPQHWMNRLKCFEELSLDCGEKILTNKKPSTTTKIIIDQDDVVADKIQEHTITESKRNVEENIKQKKKELKENLKREKIEMKESLKRDKDKQHQQQQHHLLLLQQLQQQQQQQLLEQQQKQVQEHVKGKRSYKRKADANTINSSSAKSELNDNYSMNLSNNNSSKHNISNLNNHNDDANFTTTTTTTTTATTTTATTVASASDTSKAATVSVSLNTSAGLTNLERLGLIACELLNPKIKKAVKLKRSIDIIDSSTSSNNNNPNPKQPKRQPSTSLSMKEVRKKSKESVIDSLHTTKTISSSTVDHNNTSTIATTTTTTTTTLATPEVVVIKDTSAANNNTHFE